MPVFLPIEKIDVSGRQRKYFDEMKLLELEEGIAEHDLIHAPAVLEGTLTLVAGERRLRAMAALHRKKVKFNYQGFEVPEGQIPVTFLSSRDDMRMKEAELIENLHRQDLSWQERVAAETEIHTLRKSQNPKQTLKDTVKELRQDGEANAFEVTTLSENVLLAKHFDDPEITKAKDRKTALKKIRQKELVQKRKELSSKFQLEAIESQSPHKIFHYDMRDFFSLGQELGPGMFDLLLTDPPYGIDAGNFNDQFTVKHTYEDSSEDWEDLMTALAEISFFTCKDLAHAFVFCDIRKFPILSDLFEAAGWDVWDRPLIWDKGSLGALPKPEHGPRLCYEAILFASKGDKKVLKSGRDVLPFPNVRKERHGAEKPLELYMELILRTTEPGSHIFDPFAGSGTIFPAATRSGCIALGIEKEEEYYHICLERLGE